MSLPSKEYKIHNSTLIVRFGDIVTSTAEVIVSSDDNCCTMGGGVSGTIRRAGGMKIYHDVHKLIPADLGDVLVSTAGDLPQKHIFHCITIDCYSDDSETGLKAYIIRSAVEKCMKLMAPLNISSIAFPTIGAGVAGFPMERVCCNMAEAITEFLYNTNKTYRVEIYLYKLPSERNIMETISLFETIAKYIDSHKTPDEPSAPSAPKEDVDSAAQPLKRAIKTPLEEHKVFVSYSRLNRDIAVLFCKEMDDMGISYWFDIDGTYSGENFKDVLVDAIDNTQILLFLSSKESNESPNVRKEISLAVSGNKKILPVRLDDSPYAKSIRYDLSDIDWIDYVADNHNAIMQKFRYCVQMYLQNVNR